MVSLLIHRVLLPLAQVDGTAIALSNFAVGSGLNNYKGFVSARQSGETVYLKLPAGGTWRGNDIVDGYKEVSGGTEVIVRRYVTSSSGNYISVGSALYIRVA